MTRLDSVSPLRTSTSHSLPCPDSLAAPCNPQALGEHRIPGPAHLGQFGAPSGNTKYGIGKSLTRRTENHNGLGLALADPRHPKQLTLQTKAKRRESTRRHRLRTPPVCQSDGRSRSRCSRRRHIRRQIRTCQSQRAGVGNDLRHLQALRNCPGNRRATGPSAGSCLRSKGWGKLRHGGEM